MTGGDTEASTEKILKPLTFVRAPHKVEKAVAPGIGLRQSLLLDKCFDSRRARILGDEGVAALPFLPGRGGI